jgi:hypothetical protein
MQKIDYLVFEGHTPIEKWPEDDIRAVFEGMHKADMALLIMAPKLLKRCRELEEENEHLGRVIAQMAKNG